jgi:predicted dehydrogenase
MMLPAAVIGLGRIGSRFDEEPNRSQVWSHVGAYHACRDEISLVAAAEPLEANRAAFRVRCPDVPVMANVEKLFSEVQPEIVSICTPPESHAAMVKAALACPSVRAIWCEKPLATSLEDAEAMVAACRARAVPLIVSHVRRWMPIWQRVLAHIKQGDIGQLVTLRIAMPNRLFSIGSHAIDLALMLGGRVTDLKALPLPSLVEDGEPAVAALIGLEGGAYAIVQVTGRKTELVVEAEAFGSEGRLFVREDESSVRLERFAASPRYTDYRQLGSAEVAEAGSFDSNSPFIAIAREVAALARDPGLPVTCGGESALAVQRVLADLQRAAETRVD